MPRITAAVVLIGLITSIHPLLAADNVVEDVEASDGSNKFHAALTIEAKGSQHQTIISTGRGVATVTTGKTNSVLAVATGTYDLSDRISTSISTPFIYINERDANNISKTNYYGVGDIVTSLDYQIVSGDSINFGAGVIISFPSASNNNLGTGYYSLGMSLYPSYDFSKKVGVFAYGEIDQYIASGDFNKTASHIHTQQSIEGGIRLFVNGDRDLKISGRYQYSGGNTQANGTKAPSVEEISGKLSIPVVLTKRGPVNIYVMLGEEVSDNNNSRNINGGLGLTIPLY